MSLEELSELVKDSVEPLKEKAEQRLDELSVLLKETTSILNSWDVETDQTVTLIHKTRDEHVRFFIGNIKLRIFTNGSVQPYDSDINTIFFS